MTSFHDSRFAIYLIPPYRVTREVTEIHNILQKQFGLSAAAKFQVHATIKGFFKKSPGPLAPLLENLETAFVDQRSIPIQFCGIRRDGMGISLDISQIDESPNPGLLDLRGRVVKAVYPFIDEQCDFSELDLNSPFSPHITLAFRDITADKQDEIISYLDNSIPTAPFTVNTFHFLEFQSQNWAGDWDKTLTWKIHKTWLVK